MRTVLVLITAATLLASCGPGRLQLAAPETGFGPDDFESVRDDWTRHDEDHHNVIEGRLFVSATFLSPAFRAAWLERSHVAYGWDGAARAAAERAAREEDDRWYTFFVAVSTHDWRWNKLEADDGPWRVWLEDDTGRKVEAGEIEKVRRLRRTELAEFFPYLDSFGEGYWVRFPRANGGGSDKTAPAARPRLERGTRSFELQVTGALASASLEWKLRD